MGLASPVAEFRPRPLMWVWAETRVVFWDDWTSSIYLILMVDDVDGSIQNVSLLQMNVAVIVVVEPSQRKRQTHLHFASIQIQICLCCFV